MGKVSLGNSEYRVILNTSRTMLRYLDNWTPVLHIQVGLQHQQAPCLFNYKHAAHALNSKQIPRNCKYSKMPKWTKDQLEQAVQNETTDLQAVGSINSENLLTIQNYPDYTISALDNNIVFPWTSP